MAGTYKKAKAEETASEDRWISLGKGTAKIPERLLLAHAQGKVLFITGAGISRPSGLPDFRDLVLQVYRHFDAAVYETLESIPRGACNQWSSLITGLSNKQRAEVNRFILGEYDVVLGMLERRMDGPKAENSNIRKKIAETLRTVQQSPGTHAPPRPAAIHRALMRLANRGAATTIITTNFDLLLQAAARGKGNHIQTYTLGGIPRPSLSENFSGIMHIHGALNSKPGLVSDMIVTDHDFGEYYLRRRVVPDFLYDAARLFHLVLVGYSANDAPMRYLLNAVAADGYRFGDLKERFAFVSMPEHDPVTIEDWIGRGITPIPYSSANNHKALSDTLDRWASLSAINGDTKKIEALVKRIVRKPRADTVEADRDIIDHLFRRGAINERVHLAYLASKVGADCDWLDAMISAGREADLELS